MSLCSIYPQMYNLKNFRSGGIAPLFLTSALDTGEWSASRPSHFTPRGNSPQYPLVRRLGGPKSWCGHCEEEKNLLPLLGIERTPTSL
jgi:hypothetical protein